jgi:hypothetical protein
MVAKAFLNKVIQLQGDQIWKFCANWATFGSSQWFYEKVKKPKEVVTFWATFCLSNFFTFLPEEGLLWVF